jgi:hypothetical protein
MKSCRLQLLRYPGSQIRPFAHMRQVKMAVCRPRKVGRVSPRPQGHRQSPLPLGPTLLPSAKILGQMGYRSVLGSAVSERHALPSRSPGNYQNRAPSVSDASLS